MSNIGQTAKEVIYTHFLIRHKLRCRQALFIACKKKMVRTQMVRKLNRNSSQQTCGRGSHVIARETTS